MEAVTTWWEQEPMPWTGCEGSLVSKGLVMMAKEEVYAEVGEEQDPREWDILMNGTEEEKKDLQATIARDT